MMKTEHADRPLTSAQAQSTLNALRQRYDATGKAYAAAPPASKERAAILADLQDLGARIAEHEHEYPQSC